MKRSYIETFFRHRLLLIVPVLVALVLAVGYGLSQPRKYSAGVTVFADAAIPNASTLDTGTGSSTPPATSQQAIFTQFLGTRSFLIDVMNRGPAAAHFGSLGPDQQGAALAKLAGSVKVSAVGPNVLAVTVSDNTPQVKDLANVVANSFIQIEEDALGKRAGSQVSYDQQQVDSAGRAMQDAQGALQQYLLAHPSTGLADGTASELTTALTQAQQQYADTSGQLAKSKAESAHVSDDSALRIIDAADKALPQARKKGLILAAAGGLLGGLAISVLLLVILVASDKSVRRKADLQLLPVQVVGTIAEIDENRRERVKQRSGS